MLESWELTIFDLAVGCLISGFLLTIFSIFTSGIHVGGHGGGHAHFGHLNHVPHFHLHLHLGHHANINHGHVGHTGAHAQAHAHASTHTNTHTQHQAKGQENPETPIMLILSVFLLMFGAIGTVIYSLGIFDPIIRILLTILIPIVIVKFVSIVWNRVVENETGSNFPIVSIDNQVLTLTAVDENGGLVLADTGDLSRPETLRSDEKMKMQAKTLPGTSIDRDAIAYIIDIDQHNTLIIDLWPKQADKKKSFENTAIN